MPPKHDQYATPAQKILGLFGLFVFTGGKYSLPRLAKMLNCSKQTVLRMIEQIERSHEVQMDSWLESGLRWFRVRTPPVRPKLSLTPERIQHLVLCRDMVWHLLPESLRGEIETTIAQSTVLLPDLDERSRALTSVTRARVKGAIDYTPFQETIDSLFQAIRGKRVCRILYQSPNRKEPKVHHFAPMKMLSYREALYVSGFEVTEKGTPEKIKTITMCVHRMKEIEISKRKFDILDEDEGGEGYFGFMQEEPFRVKVKFSPEVAAYVRERKWSEDQIIKELKNRKVVLEFTAQSRAEVISWVLGFGSNAEVIKPREMKDEIRQEVARLYRTYNPSSLV
jgi:predicted DNA-binding transcriptional regulator YafY